MSDRIENLKNAITAGTVFNTGILARLDEAIDTARSRAFEADEDSHAHTEGLIRLKKHISDLFASFPEKMAVIGQMMSGTEIDLIPYIGSVLGKGDDVITRASEDILDANASAFALVRHETEAYTNALSEVETHARAIEINELLSDPLGAGVLGILGGPVIQDVLEDEHQAFLERYGLGGVEEDDGSIIGEEDDDCPCC